MAPGKPGVVLELKVARARKKTQAQALSEGVAQLRENDHGAELRAAGAPVVHAFAVAFDGKKVRVKAVVTEGTKARAAGKRAGAGRASDGGSR